MRQRPATPQRVLYTRLASVVIFACCRAMESLKKRGFVTVSHQVVKFVKNKDITDRDRAAVIFDAIDSDGSGEV